MNTLQDPRLKKTTFLIATIGQVIAMSLIFLAFAHGVGWLVIVLQCWIVLVFVMGIIPMKIDTKHVRNRLRWEQLWAYPAVNVFFYGIMSGDIVMTVVYFIGICGLSLKFSSAIERIDHDYSLKSAENASKFWHT